MPRVLHISATNPEPERIAEAAAVLTAGGLVAFPTETVYGLGARGLRSADVLRIFEAKGRPHGHPLILHVENEAMAKGHASVWSETAATLARAFWPGPLTLVVERAAHVPLEVTGGLGTVGLRAPRHPVAMALIRAVGEPLAAPSANAHTHVSPTTAAHVVRSLGDRVDLVIDAGPCAHGIESTVIDVARELPRVLRAGATSLDALRHVVPGVSYGAMTVSGDGARASPGLASKHYAPHTRVTVGPREAGFIECIRVVAGPSARIGVIAWSDEAKRAVDAALKAKALTLATFARLPNTAEGYGPEIFAALHDADDAKLDVLIVEDVPSDPAWWAIQDRLRRAAET